MQHPENIVDAALVLAVRAGDSAAYGQLIERHGARIHALCYRLCGRAGVAPELAHDSFVEAFLKLDQLREPALFSAWLRRIALNVCRMWLRRRPRELSFDEEENATSAAIDAEPGPEELANLASGLLRLRAQHRVILALRYLEGLAYEEIATFLDVPIGTVMSRLHRARHALRTELLAEQQAEDPELMTTEQLKRDIEHELAVLLDAFGAGKGPAERLRVLLRNSPERFAELLQTVERHNLERLAVLLPRLGGRSIELTVLLALGDDPAAAVRARSVLRTMLARSQTNSRGGFAEMPAREVYVLVDQVLRLTDAGGSRRTTSPLAAAQLLFELLEHAPAGPVATLLLLALSCQRDEALALLLDRYTLATDASDLLQKEPHVLYGLCRFGSAFLQRVLSELRSSPSDRDPVTMAAAETISLCLKVPRRPGDAGLEDTRSAHKHPPLTAAEIGADALAELIALVARRCDDGRPAIQEAAARVLANVDARQHIATVQRLLRSPHCSTRNQALYALAELGAREAGSEIQQIAERGHPAEQCAALSAIARLKLQGSLELLRRLVEHQERSVREAAVAALGQLGSPEADALLHQLLRTNDADLARLAAEIIFREQPSQPVWSGSALARARLQRLRGDAQPFCSDSIGATIRFATRELRRYEEQELTRAIAQVCSDYSAARRHLIEQGLMTRDEGTYELTALGATIWRVEQRILTAISPATTR